MDLKEFNTGTGVPETKPWLKPVVYSLEAKDISVSGRITQGGQPTPYGLFSYTDLDSKTAGGAGPTIIGGTVVGSGDIKSASCYDGMSVRFKVGGLITTVVGGDILTFSVRDSTGAIIHASVATSAIGITTAQTLNLEFDVQIAKVGGPGVGIERSIGRVQLVNVLYASNRTSDAVTFSTLAGVEYYLFFEANDPGSVFTREIAYATILY